jgi:hypothetical protein
VCAKEGGNVLDTVVSVRFVGSSTVAEVTVGFAGSLTCTQDDGVLSLRGTEDEPVESDAFAAGLDGLGASTFGELQGADGRLGALYQTDIVGDGGDDNSDLFLWSEEKKKGGVKKGWGVGQCRYRNGTRGKTRVA